MPTLHEVLQRRAEQGAMSSNFRKGDDNAWRIRVGEFRIVFEIHDAVVMVMILRVANRRDAYR